MAEPAEIAALIRWLRERRSHDCASMRINVHFSAAATVHASGDAAAGALLLSVPAGVSISSRALPEGPLGANAPTLRSVLEQVGRRFDETIGEEGRVSRHTLGGADGRLDREDVVRAVLLMRLSLDCDTELAPVFAPWVAAQSRQTLTPLLWSDPDVAKLLGTAAGMELLAFRREAAVSRARHALPLPA